MATNSTIALRISDENKEKLDELAQKFKNKDDLVSAMINAFALSESMDRNQGRKTEIETFQTTVNRLNEMYINSLNVAEAAEFCIKSSYEAKIAELNDIIAKLEQKVGSLNEENEYLSKENTELKEQASTMGSIKNILSAYYLPPNAYITTLKNMKRDLGGFVCFREHRGGLIESMETVRYFKTVEELKKYVEELCKKIYMHDDYKADISFSEVGFDDRIGWYTVNVLDHGHAIGQADISTYL